MRRQPATLFTVGACRTVVGARDDVDGMGAQRPVVDASSVRAAYRLGQLTDQRHAALNAQFLAVLRQVLAQPECPRVVVEDQRRARAVPGGVVLFEWDGAGMREPPQHRSL